MWLIWWSANILVAILTLSVLTFAITQLFNSTFRGFPPFWSTRSQVIARAIENLSPGTTDTVYELGCGRASFLRSLAARFPAARYIGVEYAFWPYLLGRLFTWQSRERIKIIKENFFKTDLRPATLIYFYLLPEVMPRLGAKLRTECRPGTIIISYQFSLPGWPPERKISQGHDTLYFYRI